MTRDEAQSLSCCNDRRRDRVADDQHFNILYLFAKSLLRPVVCNPDVGECADALLRTFDDRLRQKNDRTMQGCVS